ncbi:MAG: ornithine cyclodeaminase family protein [Thermofilaceae archaeon]
MQLDILYLSREDLIECGLLDFGAALSDVERVLRMMAEGTVVMPPKVALEFYREDGSPKGHIIAMPAYLKELNVAGIKWAAGFYTNPEIGLPHGLDVVVLSDAETGRPLAVMEGALITAVRTGAVAGVGAKYLSPEGAATATIVGAGVVGRAAAHCIARALPSVELRIYDLIRGKAEAVAREVGAKVAEKLEEAVKGSDIVVTATTARSPVVRDSWLKRDVACIEIGKNEFEEATVLRADRIVVDYWEQIKSREWVSLTQLWKRGLLDEGRIESIASIVARGKPEGGGLRFFSPIGMACEDVIVAYRLYREAVRRGLGTRLPLWRSTDWL